MEVVLLRISAIATAAGTIAFLFIGGDWQASNLFLVPDLFLSGVLVIGALAPGRTMRAILLAGFAIGIGVFSTAVASYLVQGRFGIGATVALATCLIAGGWLLRGFLTTPTR